MRTSRKNTVLVFVDEKTVLRIRFLAEAKNESDFGFVQMTLICTLHAWINIFMTLG